MKEFNFTFPASSGLDINQIIDACQEHHNATYGVRSLWYALHGEYATLMPCNDCASHGVISMIPLGDKSNAPSYLLERNINGFYLLNDEFKYDPDAQARMMRWINEQVLPAYLLHPEITVKPYQARRVSA